MKRILTIIFAALLAAPLCRAQAPLDTPARIPFGSGESLVYNVSYRAALIPNINVMKVSLRTVTENVGGSPHFHVVGYGRTTNFVKGFFNVNDTYHSWLDAETLLPTRMTSDIQEDNHRFGATYNYDWGAMSVGTVARNAKWDADRFTSMSIKENSGDALSLLYRLRGIDVDHLQIGKRYPLDLVLDYVTRTIYFTYLGREEVKVRKLGTFRALKIKCTMATADGSTYEDGMELTAWISDDANRAPLLIDTPIKVGSVRVTLTGDHSLMYPLSSKVK